MYQIFVRSPAVGIGTVGAGAKPEPFVDIPGCRIKAKVIVDPGASYQNEVGAPGNDLGALFHV